MSDNKNDKTELLTKGSGTQAGHGVDGSTQTGASTAAASSSTMMPAAKQGDEDWDEYVGKELAGYVIKRKLAEGGMGVVYVGEHGKIGRKSAIKVLKPEFCNNREVVERFYQEARAVNEIKHENIVDIYDFGRDAEGRVFFVMELLSGESLANVVARGPLTFEQAVPILAQGLRALAAAHQKGFTHRDLKPDNIWLRQKDGGKPSVKLLDFGIAKLRSGDAAAAKLTKTGTIMGTPDYMSPEQINGEATIDQRADLYSMGCIIYEMFCQQPPFAGGNMTAVLAGHLLHEPPLLSANAKPELGVPAELDLVMARLLAKKPDERYANASDVLSDLLALSSDKAPTIANSILERTLAEPRQSVPTQAGHAAAPAQTQPNVGSRAATAGAGGEADSAAADETRVAQPRKAKTPLLIGLAVLAAGGGAAAMHLVTSKKAAPTASISTKAPSVQDAPRPAVDAGTVAVAQVLDAATLRTDSLAVVRNGLAATQSQHRAFAAQAVGEANDQQSVARLSALAVADADTVVRGQSAVALAQLHATEQAGQLASAEQTALPPLKVWYATALAELGDANANKRLVSYAKDDDLAVALKATLSLADLGPANEKQAVAALTALAAKEAELVKVQPFAGAILLGKLAGLRQAKAKEILQSYLGADNEGAKLAAAVALARVGDGSGQPVLAEVAASAGSPNQLAAAVGLVDLGDYSGYQVIVDKLGDKDPQVQRTAALALGRVGEKDAIAKLAPLLKASDPTTAISVASALLTIIATEPVMLAQAAVDWTKTALASSDLNVRATGAESLGDLSADAAMPLLASAIVDRETNVRRAAAKSAARIKSAQAARSLVAAVAVEKDVKTKEEIIKSLGTIGDQVAKPVLTALATDDGRMGMLASGSLIALGEQAAVEKLKTGIVKSGAPVRLAAVEGSVVANNKIVLPVIETGLADRDFGVRFASAEAMSQYAEKSDKTVAILQDGLKAKDLDTQVRAVQALRRLKVAIDNSFNIVPMLKAPNAAVRSQAVALLPARPWSQAKPLLTQTASDPDARVRRATANVLPNWIDTDRVEVLRLLKVLTRDKEGSVRTVSQLHLAKLGESAFEGSATKLATKPAATPDAAPNTTALQAAAETAASKLAAVTDAKRDIEQLLKDMEAVLAKPNNDDDDVIAMTAFDKKLTAAHESQKRVSKELEDLLATAGKDAAASTPAGQALVDQVANASKAAQEATAASTVGVDAIKPKVAAFDAAEQQDPEQLLANANALLSAGKLSDAKRELDRAAAAFKAAKQTDVSLDWSYGQLWDKLALREKDVAKRATLLKKAKAAYDSFAAKGSGKRAQQAKARSEEITEELAGGGQ